MSNESLVEPTNREIIEHMHTVFQETLKFQLESAKLVLSHLRAIEQRLSSIESHITAAGVKP